MSSARVKALVAVVLPVLMALLVARSLTRPSVGPVAGTRAISFGYEGLAQNVQGQIWYPAVQGSHERLTFYTSAIWGHAAPKARPAAGNKRPLILLAHGWRGTRFDLSWVGEALAKQGYVVAAINAPDSDADTFQNAQAPKTWFRASLLSRLIDIMGQDAEVGRLVDTQQVAVMGHSAGGSTALMLAGAKFDAERFAKVYPESAPVVPGDWNDARVRAVVAFNPGTGPAFAAEGVQHVHVPLLVLSGTGDHVAPEAQNAGFYVHNVAKASWVRFRDVDHYSFMAVCSPYGLLRGFGACIESHGNVDRAYVHAQSLVRIQAFLNENLPIGVAPALAAQSLPGHNLVPERLSPPWAGIVAAQQGT